MSAVNWYFYNRFDDIYDEYLPEFGEGETMATQLVTAMSKLVYKWYNDGDVFDNTGKLVCGCNDLSSYANWIYEHIGYHMESVQELMEKVFNVDRDGYEKLLVELTVETHDEEFLKHLNSIPREGTVYECDGPFSFVDYDEEEWDDDEEEEWFDDEE